METNFHGLPARSLENQHLRVEYLTAAGPRIVRLFAAGSSQNLLAEVPDLAIATPHGDLHLLGGHRLWHAPETFPRTYLPDDAGIEIAEIPDGVRLTQPVEPQSGIQKSIELRLDDDRPALTLTHVLANRGLWPVELAPWAITQMALGGLALLPQTQGALDEAGLLPNRQLVLWPYSSWCDARLQPADDFVFIDAQAKVPAVKIGCFSHRGWLGYLNHDVLFVKRFKPQPERPHPDFGCNIECYCNHRFIELETVGPLTPLRPGETATHIERWELHPAAGVARTADGARARVSALSLAAS